MVVGTDRCRVPGPTRAPDRVRLIDASAAQRSHRRRSPQRSSRAPAPLRRLRRIAVLASLFALVPVAISVLNLARQTSNSSLSVRLVEWMRDNGARGLVNSVESIYYTLSAPATGGPPLKRLPKQAGITVAVKPAVSRHDARPSLPYYYPPPIAPPAVRWRCPSRCVHGSWRPSTAASN